MAAIKPADILFPLKGKDGRFAFQSQPPFTCADSLNVWPRDSLKSKMRGGRRPGLEKSFAEKVTGPVHLLANLRTIEGTAAESDVTYEDSFYPTVLGPQWSRASWKSRAVSVGTGVGGVERGFAYVEHVSDSQVTAGVVLEPLSQAAAKQYDISISILNDWVFDTDPPMALPPLGKFSIFLEMKSSNPNVMQDGVLVEADFADSNAPTLRMKKYVNGALTDTSPAYSEPRGTPPYILKVTRFVAANVTATLEGGGVTDTNHAQMAWAITSDLIMGFGIDTQDSSAGGHRLHRVDSFKVNYRGVVSSPNRNMIVVAGGANAGRNKADNADAIDIKFEDTPSILSTPTDELDPGNPSGKQLVAGQFLGKLYIVGEDVSSNDNNKLWEFDGASDGSLIAQVKSGSVDNPPVNGFTMCVWRNRVCVVTRDDQQNVYMAKVGVPADWDELNLPVGSAVKLNTTGIDAGRLGEPITCLHPHSDDYLFFGCLNSLWVLRGDLTLGGQIDRVSSTIGIVAPQATARLPDGSTMVLSQDGLYGIDRGGVFDPQSISRERLPNELRDINVNTHRVLMAYDVRNRGVFIGITPMVGSGGSYFWFDWELKGFWPMSFNASHEPTALVFRQGDSPLDQRLVLGCRDGYLRHFNEHAATDDGVSFESHVLIGPIMLGGGGYYDGMIREVIGQTALGSADVTCEVQIGKSIEAAFNATPRAPFTLRAGKNLTQRPCLRGNAMFIKLSGNEPWAFENLTIMRERLGKQIL